MLPAKLTRPQASRALARTRLYQHLDRARTCPAVWIVGPPGAGKTTLVSGYLDARNLKGIWYQVDAGDDDPATFFHYMSIAVRHAAPRYRTPLPTFTPEHLTGLTVFARRCFEALFSRLKTPATVVLDNYQEVATDSAFHTVVAEATAVLPAGVCLLIISRAEPPPTFARLRANGMLDVLDSAELKLTLDESSTIARLRDKCKLDPSVLVRLHERTNGWAAGLVLLLEQPDSEALWPTKESGHQVLFDYFATEIFHKLDTITQSLLCQAALFPKASADWVRELTGKPEAGTILADLYRRNYFVIKQGQGEVYQFHPLFHDFLLHRAQEVFPPTQLDTLRTQAARLLEAAGNILEPPDGPMPDTWPFPLKIYTLGRFSVLIDDKPLMFSGKTQKKPLELLKGLIALGGLEVRENKLACALWPLAEDAPQALATTVHRLRKLIGKHAIERSEGCLTLSPRYCWVDVWALERQMTHLDQACQERRLVDIAPQIERIFARYGSGFLPADSDVRWASATRERLRSKLLRQIETVANTLNVTHQHDAAIGCYRKALEIDPLAEALYYGLMQCYAAVGRHAEGLSTYERYRCILNDQLGVTPSPRTAALARLCV